MGMVNPQEIQALALSAALGLQVIEGRNLKPALVLSVRLMTGSTRSNSKWVGSERPNMKPQHSCGKQTWRPWPWLQRAKVDSQRSRHGEFGRVETVE